MCFVSSFASEKLSKRPKGFASWLFFTPTFSLDKTGSNLRSLEKSLLMTNRLSSLHKLKTKISRNKKNSTLKCLAVVLSSEIVYDALFQSLCCTIKEDRPLRLVDTIIVLREMKISAAILPINAVYGEQLIFTLGKTTFRFCEIEQ